jgi:hypothetical protein
MRKDDAGDLRDVLNHMIESAEFYEALWQQRHHPTCWKMHTACALKRIRDLLDGEDGEE